MSKQITPEKRSEFEKMAKDMAANAGMWLGKNEASVQKIEKLLGKMYTYYQRVGNTEGAFGIAFACATHIVGVIERHHGKGRWEIDDPTLGPGTYPFYWNGATLFPVAWCMKRLEDGPSDNIWYKYVVMVLDKRAPKRRSLRFFKHD